MPVIKNNIILWHLLAAVIVGVWGTTFVNTKVLYNSGLTPLELFFLRFLIAYICIWFISPRRLFSRTWHDELIMLLLGVTGGSVFFLAENYAVGLTYVNNVSFIVCTAPLMTVILGIAFVRSIKARWPLIIGSLVHAADAEGCLEPALPRACCLFPLLCPVDIGHWKNRCHDLFELSVPQSCHHRCCKRCLSQRAHDCHCVCRKCVDTCGCSGGE